jgi:regulator of sigma E protease
MSIIISVTAFVVTLGVIIFIHEFGHLIACKLVGIRVIKFAFAFGKEIIGFDWKGTRYSIGWIPIGGYVKPAGEDYLEKDEQDQPPPQQDDYFGKPWYQRLLVVIAGPFMNYVLAVLIFTGVFFVWGVAKSDTNIIGEAVANLPASKAGIKAGDRIIAVQGTPVKDWNSLADIIHQNPQKKLALSVERDTSVFTVTVTPDWDDARRIGLIGILPKVEIQKANIIRSIALGFRMTYEISQKTLAYVFQTIRRMEKPKDVTGPIGIVHFISSAAQAGLREFLSLLAVLSVAIGLFNLFPIPLLDGGHMMFFILEGVLRKPLNRRLMGIANYAGMGLLLIIFLYASYNDILRLKNTNKPIAGQAEETKTAGTEGVKRQGTK